MNLLTVPRKIAFFTFNFWQINDQYLHYLLSIILLYFTNCLVPYWKLAAMFSETYRYHVLTFERRPTKDFAWLKYPAGWHWSCWIWDRNLEQQITKVSFTVIEENISIELCHSYKFIKNSDKSHGCYTNIAVHSARCVRRFVTILIPKTHAGSNTWHLPDTKKAWRVIQ